MKYKTSLTLSHFVSQSTPSQKNERLPICVWEIDFTSFYNISNGIWNCDIFRFSGYYLHFVVFIFVLCFEYLVLPVSLDCPFWSGPSDVSGLSILEWPFWCLWIVHSWLLLRFSLKLTCNWEENCIYVLFLPLVP